MQLVLLAVSKSYSIYAFSCLDTSQGEVPLTASEQPVCIPATSTVDLQAFANTAKAVEKQTPSTHVIGVNTTALGSRDFPTRLREACLAENAFSSDANKSTMLLLEGLWWKGDQIVVLTNTKLRQIIIAEAHDLAFAGHFGYTKIVHTLQGDYTWPYMAEDVFKYTRSCHTY